MSKSSQGEGAADSVGQEAPSGGTPKKTPGDIYENRGGSKKIIRVFTVMAYMFSVSFVGILLSAYYVFLWQPPNPRLLHKAHLRADPQIEFLVDTRPASLSLEANGTRGSDDKIIPPGKDLQNHQEVVRKVMTVAQSTLKADTRNFGFYPSSSIDRKYVNFNSSEERSHRVKQDSGMPWRFGRAENLTDSKYKSKVSLRNILQRSTLITQNISRANETFNVAEFVLGRNGSASLVSFVNDTEEIKSIHEIQVNSRKSNEFIDRIPNNSSSWNLTFDYLEESEENLNETEVNFQEDLQVNLPNPADSKGNETIGHSDVSPIESEIITGGTIPKKLIEESTNSYMENPNVSTYSTETLVNRTKATDLSSMDGLLISSTESTQSVVPLQNDLLKILQYPEDTDSRESTSETSSTFETTRIESEDTSANLQRIDKNR